MATFDSPEELARYLEGAGFECSVEGAVVELPCNEAELTATLQLVGGWIVFKAYLGEWRPGGAAPSTLLLLQDRLIGLRFSACNNELWALQDFPVEALGDGFHVFIDHAQWVLGTMLPALMRHIASNQPMSEDDIDAMFERLDAEHLN